MHFIDCDSPYTSIREWSEYILEQEIGIALHYGTMGVLLPSPRKDCTNYARILCHVTSYTT
jgi:hypothetical protein